MNHSTDIDIRIQWHSPDAVHAAVFVRDGEEWYLDGALVGMSVHPGPAVEDLFELAKYLVLNGSNSMSGEIALEDRVWLFRRLDGRLDDYDLNQTMYERLRAAGWDGK